METQTIGYKREFVVNHYIKRAHKFYDKAKSANTIRLCNIYIGMAKNNEKKADYANKHAGDSYIEKRYFDLTE